MQNDKPKETVWTIHTGPDHQTIEFRYSEIQGILQSITFQITNRNNYAILEMTPIQFQKIYLILRSFHDLLISDNFPQIQPPKEKLNDLNLSANQDIKTDEWDPW